MIAVAPPLAARPLAARPVFMHRLPRNAARLLGVCALAFLVACGAKPAGTAAAPSGPVAGYGGMNDNGFYIEPVDPVLLTTDQRRTEVDFPGDEPVGSIVVDTFARKLYHIQAGHRAMRYAIAVGREGLSFQGSGTIQRKQEWPSWQPTANMLQSRPDLYSKYAGGRAGGADNPLGSRAMYLYKGGQDTYFRIHGTIQNESIGRATSAGCIRMFNQDVIHLFEQVELGTEVKVRTLPESLAAEGPFMDDAWGFAVPNTAANEAQKVNDATAIEDKAAAEAKLADKQAVIDAKAAEKADKARLRACKRDGIDAADCPALAKDETKVKKDEPFIGKPAISATVPDGAVLEDPATVVVADVPALTEAEQKAADKAAAKAVKKLEADKALAATQAEKLAAAEAAANAKADKKRLRDCKAKNIDAEICPPLKKN